MSISATCPGCRSRYDLPESLAGKRVRCHKCKEEFLARGPSRGAAVEELAVALPADEPDDEPVVAELAVATSPRRPPARAIDLPPPRREEDLSIKRRGLPLPVLVGGGVAALLFVLVAGSLAVAWLWRSKGPAATGAEAAGSARKDDAIPLSVLEEIKSATVFIKVESGGAAASGSGFVMRVDGDTGYVVTNHHVITMPEQSLFGPRPFGRPRFVMPGGVPTITLVFRSGTPKEQSVRAAIAADDSQRDLAVLKVTGVANLPAPIDFSRTPDLVETMPVFLFGFPFGEALALNKGAPAITVGKGSVSSLRMNARGEVRRIQIDGDLNPGNSGGPVVDAKGRLVGVAVAKVTGTRIGLAIPPSELTKMLNKEPAD